MAINNPEQRRDVSLQGIISLWVVLFVVWMAANGTLAIEVALIGAIVTLALAYALAASSDAWRQIRWTPVGFYHFLAYTGSFLIELVKANLAMMRIVYSPRIDINPGIIRVRTRLKSPIGRLALANTIALTPGSLVLELKDDLFYIHWLDVKSTDVAAASAAITGPFEEHLEKAFG